MKKFIKSLKRKNVLMCILIILGSVFLLNFLSVKEGFPNWNWDQPGGDPSVLFGSCHRDEKGNEVCFR